MRSAEYEDSFVKIAGLIGGEEYLKVARGLVNTDDATDEEIASATGLRINIIRKVLYDMFGKALITGIRVKDEKKAGLYIDGEQKEIRSIVSLITKRRRSLTDCRSVWSTKSLRSSTIAEIKIVSA